MAQCNLVASEQHLQSLRWLRLPAVRGLANELLGDLSRRERWSKRGEGDATIALCALVAAVFLSHCQNVLLCCQRALQETLFISSHDSKLGKYEQGANGTHTHTYTCMYICACVCSAAPVGLTTMLQAARCHINQATRAEALLGPQSNLINITSA